MYLLHALFVWPSAIKDDELLSSIYLELFPKLRNILSKVEIKISLSNSKIDMRHSLTDNFFGLTPSILNEILNKSIKYDINPEIEKLLDVIWKNSKIFYHDISHNFENRPCKNKAIFEGTIGSSSKIFLCQKCYLERIMIRNIHNFRDKISNVIKVDKEEK